MLCNISFCLSFFLNLSIVASQCCGSLCCTAEWISCTDARIPCFWFPSHLFRSPQSAEQGLRCRTPGSHWLSASYTVASIRDPSLPGHPSLSSMASTCLFSMSLSLEKYKCQRPRWQYLIIKLYINVNMTVYKIIKNWRC